MLSFFNLGYPHFLLLQFSTSLTLITFQNLPYLLDCKPSLIVIHTKWCSKIHVCRPWL